MIQRLLCQRLPHRGFVAPSSSSPQSRGAESTASYLVFIFQEIFACSCAFPRAGRHGQVVRPESTWQWDAQSSRPLPPGLGYNRFHLPDQTKIQAKAEERVPRDGAGSGEQVVLKIRWQLMRTLLFLIVSWADKKILGYSAGNHCP